MLESFFRQSFASLLPTAPKVLYVPVAQRVQLPTFPILKTTKGIVTMLTLASTTALFTFVALQLGGFPEAKQPQTPPSQAQFVSTKVERSSYAAQIDDAQKALGLGKRDEALSTLGLTDPKLRGWEYDYLLAQSTRTEDEREKIKRTLDGNGFHVESVAFTADGQRIVIGSAQKLVKVCDLKNNESIDLEESKSVSGTVAASPDGKMIATEGPGGDIFLWDIATGKKGLHFKGHHLHGDAPYSQTDLIVKSICFSADSKQVVSAAYTATSGVHQKCEVKIWSVQTGQTLVTLAGTHEKGPLYITTATFSPDGKMIATGGFDKKLKLWDAVTGKEILAIEGHTNNVLSVAFSPDGKRVASASTDGTLAVWDVATGNELVRLSGHTKPVFSVAFASDGKRIVSGSWDETVKLWDAETGDQLLTLGKLRGPVLTVAISRDGKKIAAGGSLRNAEQMAEAMVWDNAMPSASP